MVNKAVVLQAIASNTASLEQLLTEIYPQLYKTAFLYVKNESDALDIVQEAVVKILNKLTTLQQPEYFTTWAIRIVIWSALDFLKKTQPAALLDEPRVIQPLSAEEQLDIYTAIGRLPQHLQEITILHYFYGKKLREISAVFDEPLGTIKYKLHEARVLLKDYLEEDGSDETK